jgi:hypothetical protein
VKSLPVREEASRILKLAGDDHLEALQVVERQLGVVVLRTQVLLSLCGIVITVTGFSGRAIAQTSFAARLSISIGIFVVLMAAATAIVGVLRLQWLTQIATDDPLSTLENAIGIREAKARYLAAALILFVIGFSLYCAAIAQLLMAQPTI